MLDAWNVPAAILARDYSILAANAAYEDRFADDAGGGEHRPSLRGRLCHEVSHHYRRPCDQMGESCPLREVAASGETGHALHVHWTRHGREHHEVRIVPLRGETGEVEAFLELLRPVEQVSAHSASTGLVGRSAPFRRCVELVTRVAPRETAVLLLGETGTGKELLARAVHELSPRQKRSFVALDCSGLTETLFESELFGHEKGAFTGAVERKRGLVEAAEGGTLFLDEVGDIPAGLQVKLLRLLESGMFRRVGSTEERTADFRLVCATHQDLERLVEEEKFRRDLYYRISVFPVRLPPLRERRDDIPLLARTLLDRLPGYGELSIADDALEHLVCHSYPGNVRELRNLLERAAVLADGGVIRRRHLPDDLERSCEAAPAPGRILPLEEEETRYVRWARRRHQGDVKSLAEALGISERTLYRKLADAVGGGDEP